MPGIYNLSLDQLKGEMDEVVALGIKSVLLFGVPNEKDAEGPVLSTIMELSKKPRVD